MTLKQGTSLREFLHWEFLKDLHINPKYLGEYLNHGQVLRAARGTHKMLDRIVNRGTRTLCLGRGVCEVLHHHLTRKVTISGNVGVGGCDNSSVVGMRQSRKTGPKQIYLPADPHTRCMNLPLLRAGSWSKTDKEEGERGILFPPEGWHQITCSYLFLYRELLRLMTQELLKGAK